MKNFNSVYTTLYYYSTSLLCGSRARCKLDYKDETKLPQILFPLTTVNF